MRRTRLTTLVLAALVTVVVFAAPSSTAIARTAIGLDPAGGFTATAGSLRFEAAEGGGVTVTCRTVLSGTLHETISKVTYSQVGLITSGTASHPGGGPCDSSLGSRSATVTLLFTVDWDASLRSFIGSLPFLDALELDIHTFQFEMNIGGGLAICLYRGQIDAFAEGPGITVSHITFDTGGIPNITRGGLLPGLCPSWAHVSEDVFALTFAVDVALLD